MVLFVPLGVLLTVALPAARGRGALVVGLAALVAAAIEAGQLFLPTRYASVTDVLIASGGAWAGLLVTRQARLLIGLTAVPRPGHSDHSLPLGPRIVQVDSARNRM
jgi:VanZ family protein